MSAFPRSLSDRLTERYEELRRQARGELGNRAGMVVFLRQGMKAWMDAWSQWACDAGDARSNRLDSENVLPTTVRNEITLVLAGMALANSVRCPEADMQIAIAGVMTA